ncbi:sulfite exporter TauE/SafE family protein [Aureibacter tunicatorum]|uniref:Probable membrane transporter protein n=1 Tax=Aureibacter tunicatorum TaxID=866807 RepID=A0AAE3XMM3_9BACT|nr:sulfite exporter TauE/SafE family protein [Aureibacter tunicatorum]MDR6237784.1 putative membrane protein YfcA [Aureibacter tunicatorum]BDD02819.1 UPF0721 transmembrane protein [Aureibacter tunicatorum]
MLEYLYLLTAGLVGGLLAGFLGIGGGIAFITILPIAITATTQIPSEEMVPFVIANSLFATVFASISGCLALIRRSSFYYHEVAYVALGAISSGLIVNELVHLGHWYSKEKFSIVIIAFLSYLVYTVIKNRNSEGENSAVVEHYKLKLFGGGVASGVISALSGLGGGTVLVPILGKYCQMKVHKSKSISLGMIFCFSFTVSIINFMSTVDLNIGMYHIGYILPEIVVPMGLGALIGSPLGVKFSHNAKPVVINIVFSLFILFLIVKYLIYIFECFF